MRKNKELKPVLGTAFAYGFGRRASEEGRKRVVRKVSSYPKCFSVKKSEENCAVEVIAPSNAIERSSRWGSNC